MQTFGQAKILSEQAAENRMEVRILKKVCKKIDFVEVVT